MSVDELRRFLSIDARLDTQQVAIDLMRLSFCLCGINLIDIFSLEKDAFDYKSMRISYMRRKTRDRTLNNSFVSVRIEPEIYDILGKYLAPKDSKYLFRFETLCGDYNSTMRIGHRVKSLCEANGMDPMTPYWFRHTWATIARNDCDVSKDDIDLCLGHTGNNPMADVYIRPDWSRVDKANRKVLDYVFGIERNEDD
jgi:integrase